MSDIGEQVAQLRKRREAALERATRARVEADRAHARAEAAREALAAEFQVSTPEEAAALERQLEQELETEAAAVREQLDLAGGAT
jgi:predicted NAD-dependent protein-ADP-ribosyltransferase YbiA (DUF1768 family)